MSKRIKKRESWKITPWYPVGYYLDIWSGFILEQDNGMWLGGLNILPSILSIPRFVIRLLKYKSAFSSLKTRNYMASSWEWKNVALECHFTMSQVIIASWCATFKKFEFIVH